MKKQRKLSIRPLVAAVLFGIATLIGTLLPAANTWAAPPTISGLVMSYVTTPTSHPAIQVSVDAPADPATEYDFKIRALGEGQWAWAQYEHDGQLVSGSSKPYGTPIALVAGYNDVRLVQGMVYEVSAQAVTGFSSGDIEVSQPYVRRITLASGNTGAPVAYASAPQNVAASTTGSTVTFTWDMPALQGDLPITGWAVTTVWNEVGTTINNPSQRSYTINSVAPCEIYTLYVFAINGADGPSSEWGRAEVQAPGANGQSCSQHGGQDNPGPQERPVTTLSDNLPNADYSADGATILSLMGSRAVVAISGGATLKGTGTARGVTIAADSYIAPGLSPGTLTVLETLDLSGTYEAELLNKDTYDKLVVGESFATPGGHAVTLQPGATLSAVLYSGWSVKQGDVFTIIDNRSNTAVSGTFAALPEGAELTVNGLTFKISYVGGDGNDVVLTALNGATDPSAPNTGLARLMKANPVVVIAMGLIAVITIGTLAVRGARRK